jgi:hypothetical protein
MSGVFAVSHPLVAERFEKGSGSLRVALKNERAEVSLSLAFNCRQEIRADTMTAPLRQYVQMTNAPDIRIVGVGVTCEAGDANESGGLESTEECFTGAVEANLPGEVFVLEADKGGKSLVAAGLYQ